MTDPLLYKSIMLGGKPWTVAAKFPGIDYYYLVSQDPDDKPRLLSKGILSADIYRFMGEVDPNAG